MRKLTLLQRVRWYAITALMMLIFCFPIYWAVVNSVKPPVEIFAGSWFPGLQFRPTMHNWMVELGTGETRRALFNSTLVSIVTTIVVLSMGSLAAYGLSTFKFVKVKRQDIVVWFLSQRVMPPVVFIVPFFIMMKSFGLLDTLYALILINVTFTLPFAVIILWEIFREIPTEVLEAACIDGASDWQIFSRLVVPLSSTGMVATGVICLAFVWNEFLFALGLSYKEAIVMPVLIGGTEHTRGIEFWFVATKTLLAMTVPIIIALAVQRYLVRGLTLGAVKG